MSDSILSTPRKHILFIDSKEQRLSLEDPTRQAILKTLLQGVDDVSFETSEQEMIMEDGSHLLQQSTKKTPYIRYWMKVPEILEKAKDVYPELKFSAYKCYYHLHILVEQELVEQYPPPEINEDGKYKTFRGMQFRTTARYFIPSYKDLWGDSIERAMEYHIDPFGINLSEHDRKKLGKLFLKSNKFYEQVMESVAAELDCKIVDFSFLPYYIHRLSSLILFDNEKYVKIAESVRMILKKYLKDSIWTNE